MKFIKMHSCGNDFIITTKKFNISICNRNIGIGCDQAIQIIDIKKYILRCIIYNNDGSKAYNCGNGIRCLGYYIFKKRKIDYLKVIIKDYKYNLWRINKTYILFSVIQYFNKYKKYLFLPKNLYILNYNLNIFINYNINYNLYFSFFFIGNYHIIIYKKYKRIIKQYNKKFNITILKHNNIKTIERGSGITYSCGTANCSALLYYSLIYNIRLIKLTNRLGYLYLYLYKHRILLIGKTNIVYKGII